MKKSILIINGHLNTGGVEKSLVDILRNLDYNRYEVDLLLLEGLGDYATEIPESVHIKLIDLHDTYGSFPKAILRCIKKRNWLCLKMRLLMNRARKQGSQVYSKASKLLLGDKHYNVAIGFRTGICTDLAAFAANADKRITWWHHGEYALNARDERDFCADCERMDHVVAVSEPCRSFLLEHLPGLKDKLCVIPNMVDTEKVQTMAAEYDPGMKSSVTNIVSVGRLSQEKHFIDIVEVGKYLIDYGKKEFHWYLIGDGPERESIQHAIAEAHLSEYFTLTGTKANPYPYMKRADLFVHPSHVESQGLVILEALSLHVPCVATQSLGACELILNGENGTLAEKQVPDLAGKVLDLLLNEELLHRIQSKSLCPQKFLTANVMKQIYGLFD